MEAYCKFHYLSVSKFRFANLQRDSNNDTEKIKAQLIREINIMEKRLKQYHWHCPCFNIYNSLTQDSDRGTENTSNVSDFSDNDDCDFVQFLSNFSMLLLLKSYHVMQLRVFLCNFYLNF